MRRIEKFLQTKGEVSYPADVAKLRRGIPECSVLTDDDIESLYRQWSGDCWAAGWMRVSYGEIEMFRAWLLEDLGS